MCAARSNSRSLDQRLRAPTRSSGSFRRLGRNWPECRHCSGEIRTQLRQPQVSGRWHFRPEKRGPSTHGVEAIADNRRDGSRSPAYEESPRRAYDLSGSGGISSWPCFALTEERVSLIATVQCVLGCRHDHYRVGHRCDRETCLRPSPEVVTLALARCPITFPGCRRIVLIEVFGFFLPPPL